MEFTKDELKIIRSALTDSIMMLKMEREDLETSTDSIEIALENHENAVWRLIEKISTRLGGI